MQSRFKLIGLNICSNEQGMSARCEIKEADTFICKINMTKEKCLELWQYCKDNWKESKMAIIEHDGFYTGGGMSVNPTIQSIYIL